ncbi:hypothetical protein ASF15_07870 [Pseudomonas sp. Leaf83]|nr:hypothetical protein ASF15_07870 [Pseudomonas sp. Leaf83]
MHVARILRAISKELSPNKLDVTWASHSLKNISFRRSKRQICNFLEFLNDRHPGLVTNDALNFLLQAAYPKQSSRNVESDDPTKSWLTDQEYDDIVRYSWNHYDLTNSTSTALIRLLSAQYARRPSQLASLKFCDLKSDTQKVISELPDNEIHFPAAKERDAGSEFRAGKVEAHPIAKHLWDMLKIQRKEIKALFEKTLNLELSDSDAVKLPVFTNSRRIAAAAEMLEEKLNLNPSQCLDDELFHLIPLQVGRVIAFEFDMAGTGAGRRLRKDERELLRRPTSSRTNQPIIVTATRLRHTRARQLARQGVPKAILSYWLGHNEDTAIDAYYDDPAEDARRFDEIMGKGLAPIAQAFHGKIIATDAEATHPSDPSKRLEFAGDERLEYLGRCGKFSFCATTSIPIPCYRCKNFEPIAGAPHEEVLNALHYRQAQEHALIKPGSLRNLLIPIDLSEDIRAVERCIELCKIKRGDK